MYFHCAQEGDKLDAIAANPKVCLSAVTKCQPTVGPKDGTFTLQYRSAIAFGTAEIVTDSNEKDFCLKSNKPTLSSRAYGCFRCGSS